MHRTVGGRRVRWVRIPPTASLLVNSDEANRYGLSGGSFGMGTGTLSATATGGNVNATFLNTPDKMTLSGNWDCP